MRTYCVYMAIATMIVQSIGAAPYAFAREDLTVTPAIIDYKAKPRDIVKGTIVLSNGTTRKMTLYAFVNNVSNAEGSQEFLDPSKADNATSLANWIEITRGVIELQPREQKTIDYAINVNLAAKPLIYHAVVAFVEASNRTNAERDMDKAVRVAINVEVENTAVEKMQLDRFISGKKTFFRSPIVFEYAIKNTGTVPMAPRGEIRIYDGRGQEVDAVDLTGQSRQIEVGKAETFTASLDRTLPMGRYKAVLDVTYGVVQKGVLSDVAFFWMLPRGQVALAVGIWLMAMIGIIIFAFRRYRAHHVAWLQETKRGDRDAGAQAQAASVKHVVDLRKKRAEGEQSSDNPV